MITKKYSTVSMVSQFLQKQGLRPNYRTLCRYLHATGSRVTFAKPGSSTVHISIEHVAYRHLRVTTWDLVDDHAELVKEGLICNN